MDEQNQVKERVLGLLTVFTVFIAVYASLHKFFLPLVLKFTSLNGTDYSDLQPTLILPLALAWFLTRRDRSLGWTSLLSGSAIQFSIYEIYLTYVGVHTGWIAFSRLLSSIPLAIVSVVFLSVSGFRAERLKAWLGVFIFGIFMFGNEWRRNTVLAPPIEKAEKPEAARSIPAHENVACGAQELLTSGEPIPATQNLRIEPCGITPSLLRLDRSVLTIENNTDQPVNLHLIIGDGKKSKTGWNRLVRAHEKAQSKEIELRGEMAGLLYSDSVPRVGIVGILPVSNTSRWSFSRKPIAIKRIP